MWKFRRTRDGSYLSGIPARDLEDAEVAALSAEDRARLEASGLYRQVDDEPSRSRAASTSERGGGR